MRNAKVKVATTNGVSTLMQGVLILLNTGGGEWLCNHLLLLWRTACFIDSSRRSVAKKKGQFLLLFDTSYLRHRNQRVLCLTWCSEYMD